MQTPRLSMKLTPNAPQSPGVPEQVAIFIEVWLREAQVKVKHQTRSAEANMTCGKPQKLAIDWRLPF